MSRATEDFRLSTVLDLIKTHVSSLGVFDQVITAEPSSMMEGGLVCSIVFSRLIPDEESSGMNITSAVADFKLKIYRNAANRPQYNIDRLAMDAAEKVFREFHEDLTLKAADPNSPGEVMSLAVFRSRGRRFQAESKPLRLAQGETKMIEIDVPFIIDDIWEQEK